MLQTLSAEWWDDYIKNKMDYMGEMSYEMKKAMLINFVDMANMA